MSEAPGSRSRSGELACVLILAILFIGVPIACTDLFPFSRAPMFADAPQCYCDFALFDEQGCSLDKTSLGLQRVYWGNPLGVGVGFHPPTTLDVFGTVPEQQEVRRFVNDRLRQQGRNGNYKLVQEIHGAKESSVGVIETRTYYLRVAP